MFSTRQNKVSRLLQKDLGEIFQRERLDIPLGSMVTITTVRITPDLKIAKVYVSIFPKDKTEEIIKLIQAQTKNIRYFVGKKIRHQVKEIPELQFFIDDSLDYIENIEKLISE